jgi:hypothetical protein
MSMTSEVRARTSWFMEPASWLSLSAAVLSASTFFLVYADRGQLTVLLPDQVGIAGQPLAVVIPLVFTNTGATRTHRHVVEATASLVFGPQGQLQQSVIPLRWQYEVQFVRQYPDANAEKTAEVVDHAVYVNRAFPFHIAGGISVGKAYRFEPRDSSLRKAEIGPLDVEVRVRTETETVLLSGKYRCPGALNANYSWCLKD